MAASLLPLLCEHAAAAAAERIEKVGDLLRLCEAGSLPQLSCLLQPSLEPIEAAGGALRPQAVSSVSPLSNVLSLPPPLERVEAAGSRMPSFCSRGRRSSASRQCAG